MKNTYPITQAQMDILNTFTCQRLTDDPANLDKIQTFHSRRGGGLVNALRNHGWSSDKRGSTAYYVIKNPQGKIMMFFSLKCGVLFDPKYVQRCAEEFSDTQQLRRAWNQARAGDENALGFLREKERQMGRALYRQTIRQLEEKYDYRLHRKQRIKCDMIEDPNDMIIRVDLAHSAIELVEFCANDRARDYWKSLFQQGFENRRHTMGKVFFWWFIVPKMIEVSRFIGCEYAYLFAADEVPDGDLVRYYEDALHFRKLTHLGAIKPAYDLNCYFMGRRLFSVDEDSVDPYEMIRSEDDLRGLDYYREQFLANFNLRTDVNDLI